LPVPNGKMLKQKSIGIIAQKDALSVITLTVTAIINWTFDNDGENV